ncbi:MAG: SinR family protein [Candidatus Moranbacteria bacterium]|nr:SinR family protein [Candidatus Moranbacteria bacterium]
MKIFFISYDLGGPEAYSDYVILSNHIKGLFEFWAKPVKSAWIVKSNKSAGQIRDEIKIKLDSNDKLIVIEIAKDWGTYNIAREVTDWMKRNI